MERYVFIDVTNTQNTTRRLLGFSIDWGKFILYFKGERWECVEAFYYEGMRKGKKKEKKKEKLENLGYKVRTKDTFIHPDKTHIHRCVCSECSEETEVNIKKQGNQKSNCDVELTVDAMDISNNKGEKEFLIFTGDGDFCFLIENIIEKDIKVIIFSNTKRDKNGNKRFSSRLKDLILREEESGKKRVTFVNIDRFYTFLPALFDIFCAPEFCAGKESFDYRSR